ncbi:hypothetical protein GCM10011385_28610 [Nitratireductor aestuarii]|uniref:DUF6680 domain-containing protein n=1 Tax=Nitratireductor aestuarii TaxID=1735103 RepID=A0A916RYW9_9HYPH|nr:DUF6680 family protein [Nitratireductor aestuarii]GGA73017.1 hypothetical protein GCM10011385_28610 [Nitratireductor aestuarii]
MNEGIDWFALATAAAALAGPVVAVWITRMSDSRKEVQARRMDIFRTLMRTRKMPIHQDHVGALNLIEVEFAADDSVIKAWKEYLRNLSDRPPVQANELVQADFFKRRETLLTKLISEMAKVLKFKVEQMDIFEGNYIPQGWHDEDWEQKIARKGLIDVLSGKRPIVIQPYCPSQGQGPYPPAPRVDNPSINAESS